MSGWFSQFWLGIPGYEYYFDVNPESVSMDEGPIAVLKRNLAGDLKKSILRSSIPIIRLNSSYLTLAQRNQFASLASIDYSFLSFQCRDDFQTWSERSIPIDASHVKLQNNSATKLSALLAAGGFTPIITIQSVYNVPTGYLGSLYGQNGFGFGGYAGPDYYAGGSYDDATRIVTLGTPLPSPTNPAFTTYTFKGWLVNMETFTHAVQGGWLDRFTYDFQLTGA